MERYLNLDKLYVLGTNCGKFYLFLFPVFTLQYGVMVIMLQFVLHSLGPNSMLTFISAICAVVDNGTRDGLDKFLRAASTDPETVLHYEFMQDYKVFDSLFLQFIRAQ